MIDLTDLDGRMEHHAERIARANRVGWLRWRSSSREQTGRTLRVTVGHMVRRRTGITLILAGVRLMGMDAHSRLGTGRIVRQGGPNSATIAADGLDFPLMLGFGPDRALYLTYPAFGPEPGERQGALLRIDLAAGPSPTTERAHQRRLAESPRDR